MRSTHTLKKIPKEIQEIYNIGDEVEIEAGSYGAGGGTFIFVNKHGREIVIDAVEFFGQNIEMHPIKKKAS